MEQINLEHLRKKIRECVRVKKIKSEIGAIFILKIGRTNIRPYLSKEEADNAAEFMKNALSDIICKKVKITKKITGTE